MINELSFNEFLNTLQDTNRKLSFYVDCINKVKNGNVR